MTGLRRHIPEIAIEWQLDRPERLWQAVDGTLCFADISGFTALAERLAQQGRVGGEELIETLSRVFGGMLERARERDGVLLKFGGDALLFLFRGEGHALRAASTAVEMRAALRKAAETPTSVGRLRLSMSVGIHSGTIHFFLVGSSHRELVLAGEDATMAARTEGAANSGEIAVSPATAALLPASAVRSREDGTLLLRWRQPPGPPGPRPPERAVDRETLRRLFPGGLGDALERGPPEPEHRVACIAFVRFSGTDALLRDAGPDAVANALQATVSTAQEAFDAEGISLLTIDIDSDGGKLFLGCGVPRASEDDEGRMLRALRRIVEAGTPLPLQFGVNRGHVFAAEVGTPWRAAYSAMGDTTNTAARICAKTPPGAIYAHPSVLDNSRTLFETRPEGPFMFKGKKTPQVVYRVGEETGTRGREGREKLPLTGRDRGAGAPAAQGRRRRGRRGRRRRDRERDGHGQDAPPRRGARRRRSGDRHQAARRALRREQPLPRLPRPDPDDPRRGTRRQAGDARGPRARRAARPIPRSLPWATLLGDVAHVAVEPSPEVAAIEPRFRPERTADTIVQLLAASRPGPLIFVMDDAQWADEASGQLLERLARECAARPWLLLFARRGDEGVALPPGAEKIELQPLTAAASAALLTAATEAAPLRPHEISKVVGRAGGNPLFIEEIIWAAREAGSLESLPGSLEAAIAAQIDGLDPAARRLLRYASVLGNSFRRSVLAGILGAEGEELDAAAVSRADAFLEADGEEHLRFRRALVRDTAYEGLAYRVRRRLHQLAGEATEGAGGDLSASADILARHFSLAGDAARTWRYACIGADRARRTYANPEAANLYRMALDAARRLPDIPTADRIRVWTSLGDVCRLAGMFEDSLAAYRNGSRLVGDDPVAQAELLRLRALARERAGAFPAALRELAIGRRLLAGQDEPDARRTRAKLVSFAAMIRFAQQRYEDAVKPAEEAAEEARRGGRAGRAGRGARSGRLGAALPRRRQHGPHARGARHLPVPRRPLERGNGPRQHRLRGLPRRALGRGARVVRGRPGNPPAGRQHRGRRDGRGQHRRDPGQARSARGGRAPAARRGPRDARHGLQRRRGLHGAAARARPGQAGGALDEAERHPRAHRRRVHGVRPVGRARSRRRWWAHSSRVRQGQAGAALDLVERAVAAAGSGAGMLAPQVAEARARALAALGDTPRPPRVNSRSASARPAGSAWPTRRPCSAWRGSSIAADAGIGRRTRRISRSRTGYWKASGP